MDRTQLCGSCDAGSIPAERTNCVKQTNCFVCGQFVGRSNILSADKMTRRGRENFEWRRRIICDQAEKFIHFEPSKRYTVPVRKDSW